MVQKIFLYEQTSTRSDYFDPHNFVSECAFSIKPQQEIVLVINGLGFGFSDDSIYKLELYYDSNLMVRTTSPHLSSLAPSLPSSSSNSILSYIPPSPPPPPPPPNAAAAAAAAVSGTLPYTTTNNVSSIINPYSPLLTTTTGIDTNNSSNSNSSRTIIPPPPPLPPFSSLIKQQAGNLYRNPPPPLPPAAAAANYQRFMAVKPTCNQLCILVENRSREFTIHVGRKTPLVWLLGVSDVFSKLCYYSTQDEPVIRANILTVDSEQDFVVLDRMVTLM